MSNNAVINRSLTTVRNELEFLKDSNVITEELYNQLCNHLPTKYNGGPPVGTLGASSAQDSRANSVSSPAMPPPAPSPAPSSSEELVEAMYDLQGRDQSDLSLFRGQQIAVLQKINEGWWRGRDIKTGHEGIFPSNYVRPISGDEKARMQSPAPPYYPPQQGYYPQQQYQPPPQQQYNPMMQAVQPQQQVVEQPQQQGSSHHLSGGVKKFGSKLGNAAIFGAGATIGSDIVNSIF